MTLTVKSPLLVANLTWKVSGALSLRARDEARRDHKFLRRAATPVFAGAIFCAVDVFGLAGRGVRSLRERGDARQRKAYLQQLGCEFFHFPSLFKIWIDA